MCPNPQGTAYGVMVGLRPEIVNILTLEGVANTTEATTVLSEYDVSANAIKNWKAGSAADDVLQVIAVFQAAVAALGPLLPIQDALLVNAILAAVAVVIGIIKANSPAPPAPAESTVSAEENQFHHANVVRQETEDQVEALVPGFKVSRFHTAESQAHAVWNKAAEASGHPDLKV